MEVQLTRSTNTWLACLPFFVQKKDHIVERGLSGSFGGERPDERTTSRAQGLKFPIMPITSRGYARSSLALLIVGLLTLLGIVGATIWLVERTQVYFEEVVEAREARHASVNLRNMLQDAQSGQRGYLITLDSNYLDRYQEAVSGIVPGFQRLSEVLSPYPQAIEPLAEFREDMDFKLGELAQTIELARTGEIDEAVAIVRTDQGKEAMDRMRFLLDAVINAADTRSLEGVTEQRNAANALRLVALGGAVLIIFVIGGSVVTVMRYTNELDRARAEVSALNADLEARVAERTLDLQRANEEVQRFAYIVTHDLRAPLVNIMGFTSELDASLPPIKALVNGGPEADAATREEARIAAEDDLPEAIGFIRSSTKKMDALINAILKISREGQRHLKAERIELAELLEVAGGAVQHQIAETEGKINYDIKTPTIFSDRLSIEQIVGNLLDNAVKYRDPSRPIEIDVRARQERSGEVTIEVADNGRGIAEDDHERIFELFRRSGTQDKVGEGIGLSHVRIMCRNLGGDIKVNSKLGEGATFTVTIAPDLRAIARRAA
jgi:signal transduction histidine kinase